LGTRTVWFQGQAAKTQIYERGSLVKDQVITGPAIVEQLDTTIVIPPGFQAAVEDLGNLIIEQCC
jgi:N-methylhydantoinase A